MAMAKRAGVFLMLLMGLCGVCFGALYNVGDSAGWAVGMNYNQWASTNKFHVGDTLVFNYNNQFHNVLQVSHEDYESCNAKSPIATFTSGQDSITLKQPGKSYFLCGFPGHCQAGLKLQISADPSSQTPIVVPSPPAPRVNPTPKNPPGVFPNPQTPPVVIPNPNVPCPPGLPNPNVPSPPGHPFDTPFVPGQPSIPYDPYNSAASLCSSQIGVALAIFVFLLACFAY